jgi:histidine ammonia-lyase
MKAVTITEAPLAVEELVEVVGGAQVELGPGALARIRASRAVVDQALDSGDAIYGLTTGIGHLKDTRLPDEELRRAQQVLVMTHAGGIGPTLPTELVRAALMARLNGIARGGSGASPAVAETLAAMLNAGVHPLVAETGSVGAGDLAQMAAMALVAIGRGSAEYTGEILPGGEALRRAGIDPLELQPKDGLALVSANAISIGHGALVLVRAARAVDAADLSAALSLEATGGNPSVALPVVGRAKPFAGQIEACRRILAALEGSYLLQPAAPSSIQDPLSFRVAPQVHGALGELLGFARRAVETELNSQSDNPLVSVADQAMVHNGNFHPIVLALAFDGLRGAIAHVGQLSERRMSHLWDAFFGNVAGLGAEPPGGTIPRFPGLSLRYPAAALSAELKQLAAPATLDVPTLETGGLEDHGTSAPLSVRKADAALGLLEDLLAVELLMAHDTLSTRPARPTLGAGTGAALRVVEEVMAASDPTGPPAEVHRALRARLPAVLGARPTTGRLQHR